MGHSSWRLKGVGPFSVMASSNCSLGGSSGFKGIDVGFLSLGGSTPCFVEVDAVASWGVDSSNNFSPLLVGLGGFFSLDIDSSFCSIPQVLFMEDLLRPQNSLQQHGGWQPDLDLKAIPFPFGIVASISLTSSNYLLSISIGLKYDFCLPMGKRHQIISLVDRARKWSLS